MCKKIVRGSLYVLTIISVLAVPVMLFSTTPIENILIGFIGGGIGLVLGIAIGYPLRRLFLAVEDWLND